MSIITSESEAERGSIIVQTRKGSEISNCQSFIISSFEKSLFPDYVDKYRNVIFRSHPTGIYNCHGLVFASRRTGIDDSREILKILREDNYKEISRDEVLPGDIILYFAEDGDIEHSGIVISRPDSVLHIPKVYSKWGRYREAIHYANDCEYDFSQTKYYRVLE